MTGVLVTQLITSLESKFSMKMDRGMKGESGFLIFKLIID